MEPQHHLSSARRLLGAVQGVTFQETWMVPRPEGRLEEDCGKPRKKKKKENLLPWKKDLNPCRNNFIACSSDACSIFFLRCLQAGANYFIESWGGGVGQFPTPRI